ncbi:MAG: hypothetical protein ACI4AH_07065 [Muribaculaceae bacterium]
MKQIFLIIALALASLSANALVLTWSIHNLTFEVPDGGTVTYNSATHFEIMWQDMALVIDIYNKDGATDENMRENLLRRANGYNMFDNQTNKIKVKGFKCHSLTGTMPDGSHTLLANLICNNRNLLVMVTVNYMLGDIEEAEDIVKSITIGKQKIKKEKKQKIQSEEDAKAIDQTEEKRKQEQNKSTKNHKLYDI